MSTVSSPGKPVAPATTQAPAATTEKKVEAKLTNGFKVDTFFAKCLSVLGWKVGRTWSGWLQSWKAPLDKSWSAEFKREFTVSDIRNGYADFSVLASVISKKAKECLGTDTSRNESVAKFAEKGEIPAFMKGASFFAKKEDVEANKKDKEQFLNDIEACIDAKVKAATTEQPSVQTKSKKEEDLEGLKVALAMQEADVETSMKALDADQKKTALLFSNMNTINADLKKAQGELQDLTTGIKNTVLNWLNPNALKPQIAQLNARIDVLSKVVDKDSKESKALEAAVESDEANRAKIEEANKGITTAKARIAELETAIAKAAADVAKPAATAA